MYSTDELKDITHFLLEYANRLMGSGVHTSRVVRNTCRIGHSLNVETNVCVMQNNLLVNVRDTDSREVYNEMASIPAFPISFELNAELSALSWDAHDQHLSLPTLRERYAEIIAHPKMDPFCTLFLAAFANGTTRISNVAHLRIKETDRIKAPANALRSIGVTVEEKEDGLVIEGKGSDVRLNLQGMRFVTSNDHRMAMGFSLTGLRADGIEIDDPGCCRKTFAGYFEVLDKVTGGLREK